MTGAAAALGDLQLPNVNVVAGGTIVFTRQHGVWYASKVPQPAEMFPRLRFQSRRRRFYST
jgi:hypothetical protein